MKCKSKYLYKYKKIETAIDLTRILDIILNKRIYLPRYEELNDPFESYMNYIRTTDAGSSILENAGLRRDCIDVLFKEYGILSLTPNCRNQVMWTMYTNYYNGICIGFEDIENAKKIQYREKSDNLKKFEFQEIRNNEEKIRSLLMIKHDIWNYEDEYRFISKEQFLDVSNNLKFIIIGQNLDKVIKKLLYEVYQKEKIDVYETYISHSKGTIIIKKYPFEYKYDGSTIEDDLYD